MPHKAKEAVQMYNARLADIEREQHKSRMDRADDQIKDQAAKLESARRLYEERTRDK